MAQALGLARSREVGPAYAVKGLIVRGGKLATAMRVVVVRSKKGSLRAAGWGTLPRSSPHFAAATIDLNNRTAVVIKDQRSDGRIGVRMNLGEENVWIHAEKLLLIHGEAALNRVPFNRMSGRERNAALLFLLANKGLVRIPGAPGIRLMSTSRRPRHS